MISLKGLCAATALIVLCTFYLWKHRTRFRYNSKLPPGPCGIPIFGNYFQIPILRPHPKFLEWARQYGEVFSLYLGPQTIVVLNSSRAADEVLGNRSKIYSSRVSPHVVHDLMSAGSRPVFLPYGEEWKVSRKTLQGALGPVPSKKLREMQELESRVLMWDLMVHGDQSLLEEDTAVVKGIKNQGQEIPDKHWFSLIRRYASSVQMIHIYGKRLNRSSNNERMHKIYDVMSALANHGTPGSNFAEIFPILRKLPKLLAPWQTLGNRLHKWEMELWGGLLQECKDDIANGKNSNSFIVSYLRQRSEAGYPDAPGKGITADGWIKDLLLAYVAATPLEAGSDTTSNAIETFILFMLSHPHVLRRAREEMDAVVGDDRMPDFEDENKLPYLIACIKETLRRRPPIIMGIPHRADEDDWYEGMFIPKGTMVVGNIWAIHMDPRKFPNPMAFDPERYLEKDGSIRWESGRESHERSHYTFGWGRRFCQGSYIAEASLFIVISRIIWGIDLQAPIDPVSKKPIIPDINNEEATFSTGFISVVKAFPAIFHPRSPKKAATIQKAFEDAQRDWEVLDLEQDVRA